MSNENIDQPTFDVPSVAASTESSTDAAIQVETVSMPQPDAPNPAQILSGEILARLGSLELELRRETERVEAGLNSLSGKVAFIPPQIRNLGAKIDAVASVAADSKYSSLLLTLLGLFDLVGQMRLDAGNGEREGSAKRPLDVVFTQIQQILEGNGLKEIAASETLSFDPAMHCAIQVVPTEDTALDGKIKRPIRPGFTLVGRTLRFAEVEIWKLRVPTVSATLPAGGAASAPESSERSTD